MVSVHEHLTYGWITYDETRINLSHTSITAILKPGFRDVEAETEFPKKVGLSDEATFDDPPSIIFSLPFFNREPFKSGSRGPFAPSKS